MWETKPFPAWNPQAEFTSAEENSEFQGIFADGTRLFLPLFSLVEILISTKGVDKVDTLKPPVEKQAVSKFAGKAVSKEEALISLTAEGIASLLPEDIVVRCGFAGIAIVGILPNLVKILTGDSVFLMLFFLFCHLSSPQG